MNFNFPARDMAPLSVRLKRLGWIQADVKFDEKNLQVTYTSKGIAGMNQFADTYLAACKSKSENADNSDASLQLQLEILATPSLREITDSGKLPFVGNEWAAFLFLAVSRMY